MKVNVLSNMCIYGVFEPPVKIELEEPKATLRKLLEVLTDLCESVEFISDDEVGSDVQAILVNETEYQYLDTPLNADDIVQVIIEMAPLGGG